MIAVFGAGGHGRVVASALRQLDLEYKFYDDNNPDYPPIKSFTGDEFIVAIGYNKRRMEIFLDTPGRAVPVIHPLSSVSGSVMIGNGTFVSNGAIVNIDAVIGDNCIINTGAIVEHDAIVCSHSHVAPGAVVLGGAIIGEGVLVGAGAVVLPGRRVPDGKVVRAGSLWEWK